MIDRNLRIALVISLSLHVFLMSAVVIVMPGGPGRQQPYTKVSFLGPILEKTAFDIMLEHANPVMVAKYNWLPTQPKGAFLKAASPGRKSPQQGLSFKNGFAEMDTLDFLAGQKAVPDLMFGRIRISTRTSVAGDLMQRKVRYKPASPGVTASLYGGKDSYRIKVRAFVDGDGNVRRTEPITTTGYPQLDIVASKYVKDWIFEPAQSMLDESPTVVEVFLKASRGDDR